jgi:alpha-beta hydrolase superfamily lysophospholipase
VTATSLPAGTVVDPDLGTPFTAETIALPDDHEGPVEATLVRLAAKAPTTKAVLHVHGFADYFFQAEYAAWWADRGYDFYALDLRKYGRSIRAHQTANFAADLSEYYPELDEAWSRITGRDGHDTVLVTAHSTGGLTTPLWVDDRRPAGLAGMFLNSPWLDLQGPAYLRTVVTPIVKQVGKRMPLRQIPRSVSGFYTRSLHQEHEGEWAFNLTWKPLESFPVYAGWLRAIRNGHARLHAGLEVPVPVLVVSSGASGHPEEMDEVVHGTDIVLDVAQIRRWATAIGPHVTYEAIQGARHDVVLSRPDVRAHAYDVLDRWLRAWVEA